MRRTTSRELPPRDGCARLARLSTDGARYAEANAAEPAAVWAPFTESAEDEPASAMKDLKPEIGPVMSAVWQIATTGSEEQTDGE